MKRAVIILPLLIWAAVGACGVMDSGCELFARMGITVEAIDAQTGEPVSGDFVAVATEGTYVDSLTWTFPPGLPPGHSVISLVEERPGSYRVELEVAGYEPWARDEVNVPMDADGCHVVNQRLAAYLVAVEPE